MGKRVQRRVLLVGVLLACLGAVATARPEGQVPRGYSRLLTRQARLIVPQESVVEDCLMEKARLGQAAGASGRIPDREFEELRRFCRAAAKVESPDAGSADPGLSDTARQAARQRLREQHRQAMQALAVTPETGS